MPQTMVNFRMDEDLKKSFGEKKEKKERAAAAF